MLFAEELIGSADQKISDVVADVQATFGGAEPDNLGQGDETPDIGSLVSETQSQSVDFREPVTQPEDAPAQLAAESLRQKKKIYESHAPTSKAFLEENLANSSDPIEPDVSGTSITHGKDRVGVRKGKLSKTIVEQVSRVNPSPGTGVDGKRHSPRVKVSLEASVSPAKAPALSKVTKSKHAAAKKTKPVGSAKDTKGKVKREPAKAKKPNAAGKGNKTVVTAKKAFPTAKKSVRFEKDDDFVPDEEEDVVSHDEGGEDSDFDTDDVSKVIFF